VRTEHKEIVWRSKPVEDPLITKNEILHLTPAEATTLTEQLRKQFPDKVHIPATVQLATSEGYYINYTVSIDVAETKATKEFLKTRAMNPQVESEEP
jgi:hypothetical protein